MFTTYFLLSILVDCVKILRNNFYFHQMWHDNHTVHVSYPKNFFIELHCSWFKKHFVCNCPYQVIRWYLFVRHGCSVSTADQFQSQSPNRTTRWVVWCRRLRESFECLSFVRQLPSRHMASILPKVYCWTLHLSTFYRNYLPYILAYKPQNLRQNLHLNVGGATYTRVIK